MSYYDKYYQKQDYFGKPYPELINYFSGLKRDLTIIDIGCGQGRDSLALGRLGFEVIGIDASQIGINQLNQMAYLEGISVKGLIQDIDHIDNIHDFDVILLDSMFHFYKKDEESEKNRLKKYMHDMKSGARIVIIMQYHPHRVKLLKEIFNHANNHFASEYETTFIYQECDAQFYMISLIKM